MSLRPKFTTLDVNTTLENTVNRPAIPMKTLRLKRYVSINWSVCCPNIGPSFLTRKSVSNERLIRLWRRGGTHASITVLVEKRAGLFAIKFYANSAIKRHRVSRRIERYHFPQRFHRRWKLSCVCYTTRFGYTNNRLTRNRSSTSHSLRKWCKWFVFR